MIVMRYLVGAAVGALVVAGLTHDVNARFGGLPGVLVAEAN